MEIVMEPPLDPGKMFERIRKSKAGSVIFHYVIVKGRTVDRESSGIRFERGGDMEAELAEISANIKGCWTTDDVLLVRRIGTLRIGEVISLIAVSSAASNDAFEACHYGLERLKKMTSIKKTELFRDQGKQRKIDALMGE